MAALQTTQNIKPLEGSQYSLQKLGPPGTWEQRVVPFPFFSRFRAGPAQPLALGRDKNRRCTQLVLARTLSPALKPLFSRG